MNLKIVAAGASALSLAAGAAAGYFFATKRLEAKYAKIAEKEIAQAKTFYKSHYKAEEFSSPSEVLQRRQPGESLTDEDREVAEAGRNDPKPDPHMMEKVLNGLKYGKPSETEADGGVETVNIFDRREDEIFEKERLAAQKSRKPYVISVREHEEGDPAYEQVTYTYYAGDSVLVDDSDQQPIDDVESHVGEINLTRFGYRSEDPSIVYVRNERLGLEIEVCKSDGTYAEDVLEVQPRRPRR